MIRDWLIMSKLQIHTRRGIRVTTIKRIMKRFVVVMISMVRLEIHWYYLG